MTLLEEVIERGIPFLVGQSFSHLASSLDYRGDDKTLFIAVSERDNSRLRDHHLSKSVGLDLFEQDLTRKEVEIFDQNNHLFEVKESSKYGKIYEMKNSSFKEYYQLLSNIKSRSRK